MPQTSVTGEYAQAGVDYTKIEPFKMAMIGVAKRTVEFPLRRNVRVITDCLHSHGGTHEYVGTDKHRWCMTHEGLGNKNWIAEWMYMRDPGGGSRYEGIGYDTAMMAVGDVIAQGAMPVTYTDEVAAGDSEWFKDAQRAKALTDGFYEACKDSGMALVAGESPALRYLVKAEPPVKSAPSLSGCVTGIIAPARQMITGKKLKIGDRIVGFTSSGIHSNGISLIIKRALGLPDQFMTKLSNGKLLGDEALIPTRCYVGLIERMLEWDVDIHALLPGTGGGIGKVAFDKRQMTYRIHSWPEVPFLFQFMRELGVSLPDCLTTFNWGIGYYAFIPSRQVKKVIDLAADMGYTALEVGRVEAGERKVIFEPEGITLPPPGD